MLKLEISEDVKATIEYEVEFDGTEEEFIKKYKKNWLLARYRNSKNYKRTFKYKRK